MKRRQTALVILVVLLLGTVTISQLAVGNFNAATGFSGRHGFTCTSCHNVPDMGPAGDDEIYESPAEVTLTGLPGEWNAGQTYSLDILVTGGPPDISTGPVPSGGFEIESDVGTFSAVDGNTRVYDADGRGVTYTQAGAMIRFWTVEWHAPVLDAPPVNATFWVAGMAANGNHAVAAGQSDFGELGDSVDNITITISPSQATIDAWLASRLETPRLDSEVMSEELTLEPFEPFSIRGVHQDANATHLGYKLDDGEWQRKSVAATNWRLDFDKGLSAGSHVLLVRSETDDRQSDPVEFQIHVEENGAVNTPSGVFLSFIVLLLAAVRRTSK